MSFDFFLFCWWFPCCGFLGYGLVCLTVIVCRLICALGCFNSVDLFSCYLIFICDLVSLCLLGCDVSLRCLLVFGGCLVAGYSVWFVCWCCKYMLSLWLLSCVAVCVFGGVVVYCCLFSTACVFLACIDRCVTI